MAEIMESWRKVWRDGLAPLISTNGLKALRKALVNDDPRLLQGATTSPPPLQCLESWPVEAACALSYTGWQGDGLETVAEVEEFFGRVCFGCDTLIGEPAGVRFFLNAYDSWPREEMRRLLLAEVNLVLAQRQSAKKASHE